MNCDWSRIKLESQIVTDQRVKTQVCHEGLWRHGDTALPIINHYTRWMCGVISMPWLFQSWWKRPQYPLTRNIKTVWIQLGCILFTNIRLHADILFKQEHFCLTEALKLVTDTLNGQTVLALAMISAWTNVIWDLHMPVTLVMVLDEWLKFYVTVTHTI